MTRERFERDMDAEMRSHIAMATDELVRQGVPPDEARRRALVAFGGVDNYKEESRAGRVAWADLALDLRFGLRVLRRARGFTAVAVLVLGLGIGASATMFSAIRGVLLRPLPYRDPARLVAVREWNREMGVRGGTAAATFVAWSTQAHGFESFAAYRYWGFDLTGTGDPERLRGARVSSHLFRLLGSAALRGRTFTTTDADPAAPAVVLLSEGLWRRRFGGDDRIVGTPIQLSGATYVVAGVMPQGFGLPDADVWVPLRFASYELDQRGDRSLSVIGRLAGASSSAVAAAELNGIERTLRTQFPTPYAGWEVRVRSLHEEITGSGRAPLLLLFAATALVLIVACANLANLLLARGTIRRREIALRAALGASRKRIVRQLVTETLLLVALAGALGALLAVAATRVLATWSTAFLPRASEISIDLLGLGFVVLITLIIGAVLGIIPAQDAAHVDLNAALKAGAAHREGRWTMAPRDVPVVAQVALALLLLVGGGLLVRSLQRVLAVDLGFTPARVLSFTVSLPAARYAVPDSRIALFQALRSRTLQIPGVRAAGLVSHLPLAGGALSTDFAIEGSVDRIPRGAHLVSVTPGYFATLEVSLLHGRDFTDADRGGVTPVVIVDDVLARRFWPRGDAVGQRIRLGVTLGADTAWREIVGVAASVRSSGPERDPDATIYVPHAQNPWPTMGVVIRASRDPSSLTRDVIAKLRALDPDQPVYNLRTLRDVVDRVTASRRVQTVLVSGFAVAALVLSLVGVWGMLSYALALRTRELALRVALGADRTTIVRHCLRRALLPVALGLVIGLVATVIGAGALRSTLFAIEPTDPITLVGAVLLLGGASLGAAYVPAARAARLEPVTALRADL